MDPEARTALPEGKMPQLRVVPMPADANVHGDVFGGWIMTYVATSEDRKPRVLPPMTEALARF
jgi:acyl-CoA hydrolase